MNSQDLQRFCAIDQDRYYINKPFSLESFTYATDGKLLIRVSRLSDVPEIQGPPDPRKIWPDGTYPAYPLPEIPEPTFETCPVCKGKGEITYHDEDDDGNKSSEIDECYNCEGDKSFAKVIPMKIGCAYFSNHYLAMIKDLPNIRIAPTKELEAAILMFDGGDGLLMPMKA